MADGSGLESAVAFALISAGFAWSAWSRRCADSREASAAKDPVIPLLRSPSLEARTPRDMLRAHLDREETTDSEAMAAFFKGFFDLGSFLGMDVGGSLVKLVFFEPDFVDAADAASPAASRSPRADRVAEDDDEKALRAAVLSGAASEGSGAAGKQRAALREIVAFLRRSDTYGGTGHRDADLSFHSSSLSGTFHFIRFVGAGGSRPSGGRCRGGAPGATKVRRDFCLPALGSLTQVRDAADGRSAPNGVLKDVPPPHAPPVFHGGWVVQVLGSRPLPPRHRARPGRRTRLPHPRTHVPPPPRPRRGIHLHEQVGAPGERASCRGGFVEEGSRADDDALHRRFDRIDPCVRRDPGVPPEARSLGQESLYPFLLVNIGSGVSILLVRGDHDWERVSGTSIGGGTFYGLCHLITGMDSFDEMVEAAARGVNSNVDLTVGDIYGGDYAKVGLRSTTIASNLGKIIHQDIECSGTSDASENGSEAAPRDHDPAAARGRVSPAFSGTLDETGSMSPAPRPRLASSGPGLGRAGRDETSGGGGSGGSDIGAVRRDGGLAGYEAGSGGRASRSRGGSEGADSALDRFRKVGVPVVPRRSSDAQGGANGGIPVTSTRPLSPATHEPAHGAASSPTEHGAVGSSRSRAAAFHAAAATHLARHRVAPEDVSRALLLMISNNIGQVAYLNALRFGVKRVFFAGNFLRHCNVNDEAMRTLAYAISFWSKGAMEGLFLKHEGYFGAIGAFLSTLQRAAESMETDSRPAAELHGAEAPTDASASASAAQGVAGCD